MDGSIAQPGFGLQLADREATVVCVNQALDCGIKLFSASHSGSPLPGRLDGKAAHSYRNTVNPCDHWDSVLSMSSVKGASLLADLVLLSGGIDSATALAQGVDTGRARLALSIDYGQRHRKELSYASELARFYAVPHLIVDLSGWGALIAEKSELLSLNVLAGAGAGTVVPNRNAVLIAVAGSVALAAGCTAVVVATHAGDHEVYADCRPEFLEATRQALKLATEDQVDLVAPFSSYRPDEIVTIGGRLGVPFAQTWSCYNDGRYHCGKCGACVKRRDSFVAASVVDPTVYV